MDSSFSLFGEFEQFGRAGHRAGRLVHVGKLGRQARAFLAQFLGALGLVPDGGVFELAAYFFEPLFLVGRTQRNPLKEDIRSSRSLSCRFSMLISMGRAFYLSARSMNIDNGSGW